jgi:hypothetical protein
LIEFLPSGWLLFIKVLCAFQRAKQILFASSKVIFRKIISLSTLSN